MLRISPINDVFEMRELRRLVGEVAQKDIKYALSTDLNEHQAKHYLPVINCRECGQTGWASVEDNGSVEIRDIRAFYNAFFSGDSKVRIMFPHKEGEEAFTLNNRMRLCPKCGNPGWADAGQVRSMFKVQMVYSNMKEEESQIGDDSEDRASMFYDKELLVDVDEDKDVIQAFEMDNKEFKWGYEFLQKATMREINFGEQSITGDKLLVAGHEGVRKGFPICKYCGKIQVQGEKPKHSRFCKMVKDNTIVTDPFEECLFLYREFETEALRLLIHATTMDATNVRVESFVAAFILGMKKKFGNVDYLRATISEVPVPEADYRKQYLVIYDSVPGGTGYLKQLSSIMFCEIVEQLFIYMKQRVLLTGCSVRILLVLCQSMLFRYIVNNGFQK